MTDRRCVLCRVRYRRLTRSLWCAICAALLLEAKQAEKERAA